MPPNPRIHARDSFPIWVTVQLGLLVTVLVWIFLGAIVGSVMAVVSAFFVWRALHAGFVVDARGLAVRPLLPGGGRIVPWSELRSVDVDEVVTGTNDGRETKIRIRFMTETEQLELVGASAKAADRVVEVVRARGLLATDGRPGATGANAESRSGPANASTEGTAPGGEPSTITPEELSLVVETLTDVLEPDRSWVLFEYGTCVVLPEPEGDLSEQAIRLLREWGPVHPGSPAGDFGVIDLGDDRGWLITCHHPDIVTFLEPGPIPTPENVVGLMGRSSRGLDAEALRIVHVEDKR